KLRTPGFGGDGLQPARIGGGAFGEAVAIKHLERDFDMLGVMEGGGLERAGAKGAQQRRGAGPVHGGGHFGHPSSTQSWYVGIYVRNIWLTVKALAAGGIRGEMRPQTDGSPRKMKAIERIQTGVRIETRTLKVLKGLAEALNLTLGELL